MSAYRIKCAAAGGDLVQAVVINPGAAEADIRKLGLDEDMVQAAVAMRERCILWRNDVYTVSVIYDHDATHLSIKRNDRSTCHDWRDFQAIKNAICGPEREAVEIYPAESRLVDTANQYHLWVLPAGARVPYGFNTRLVIDAVEGTTLKQRPLAKV